MPKRSTPKTTSELVKAFNKSRETFMDAASRWIQVRQRFLILIGRQPKPDDRDQPPKDRPSA